MREAHDIGQFCLESSADLRLTFRVGTIDGCLSACDENRLSCRATRVGTRIDLVTLLQSRDIPGVDQCPDVCENASGTCWLEVPAPGRYEFGFASRFDTATLPLEGSIPLFGYHGCRPPGPVLPNP